LTTLKEFSREWSKFKFKCLKVWDERYWVKLTNCRFKKFFSLKTKSGKRFSEVNKELAETLNIIRNLVPTNLEFAVRFGRLVFIFVIFVIGGQIRLRSAVTARGLKFKLNDDKMLLENRKSKIKNQKSKRNWCFWVDVLKFFF
jgi:hypothetical protein